MESPSPSCHPWGIASLLLAIFAIVATGVPVLWIKAAVSSPTITFNQPGLFATSVVIIASVFAVVASVFATLGGVVCAVIGLLARDGRKVTAVIGLVLNLLLIGIIAATVITG